PDSRCCVNLFGIGDALAYGRFMQQSLGNAINDHVLEHQCSINRKARLLAGRRYICGFLNATVRDMCLKNCWT
ncbi:hypothetical protein, partial [Comamonas sp. HJ-2]